MSQPIRTVRSSKAETVGATVTAFVISPPTALAIATIKQATGSNQPAH